MPIFGTAQTSLRIGGSKTGLFGIGDKTLCLITPVANMVSTRKIAPISAEKSMRITEIPRKSKPELAFSSLVRVRTATLTSTSFTALVKIPITSGLSSSAQSKSLKIAWIFRIFLSRFGNMDSPASASSSETETTQFRYVRSFFVTVTPRALLAKLTLVGEKPVHKISQFLGGSAVLATSLVV